MKKVAFHTLGCKVNQYETEAMEEQFENSDYKIVPFSEVADIYIINTCTVTNIADKKSRQMLSKARSMNEDGVIVAVGCYAQIAEEELKKNENIDLIIGNTNKDKVVNIVENYITNNTKTNSIVDMSENKEYEELWISKINDKTRAYIKIQDGCNQFCSYCIIPYTRGRIRSRKSNNILKEVNNIVSNGYKEIVLTGIHLASYGKGTNYLLIDLLEDLNCINGLERIRLGSLEPNIITEQFLNRLIKLDKVCPHFHLSLQSGCDETLMRMNRKYTTTEYYNKVEMLRNYYINPSITTDIIVGFPGETEEEFDNTLNFVKKVAFSNIHIFKYSVRRGTRAANMKNQVESKTKSIRSKKLEKINKINYDNYINSYIGKTIDILFEEDIVINETHYNMGHSNNYLKVLILRQEMDLSNSIKKVTVKSERMGYLEGDLV
jgi:threonylcarbamoyladenosine tRNA methylthiotransferase MtaB